MKDKDAMTNQTRTPAQNMAVTPRESKAVVSAEEREMRYVPFASDTEIKLTVAIVTNMICIPTKQGHRCTPQDAIRFMMMCQARKLNPFEGDAFLQGYDSSNGPTFNLITAHQAFLKRAEVNDEYDGMESGVMVLGPVGDIEELQGDFVPRGKTLVGGWAKVHHKNRKIPTYRRLDLNVFRKVNREGKAYGRWEDDPAGMIVKCAEADALRSSFPTMLGNLYLEQELNPTEKIVTPAPQIAAPSFITQPTPEPVLPTPAPTYNGNAAPLPEDEPEPEPKPKAEPPPAPSEKPDPTAHLDPPGVLKLLGQWMERDGVSEDQVMAHLRNTKVAKHHKELAELSDSKCRTLANAWERELPIIKAITI